MSLIKRALEEIYGGVGELDKIDRIKNDPKAVAKPFTRYLLQRDAAEEEETERDVPMYSQNPTVESLLRRMYGLSKDMAFQELYDAIANRQISAPEMMEVIKHYQRE